MMPVKAIEMIEVFGLDLKAYQLYYVQAHHKPFY